VHVLVLGALVSLAATDLVLGAMFWYFAWCSCFASLVHSLCSVTRHSLDSYQFEMLLWCSTCALYMDLLALYMDCTCFVHGLHLLCTWIVFALYMDLLALYMDCTCSVDGSTCFVHGSTCFVHGLVPIQNATMVSTCACTWMLCLQQNAAMLAAKCYYSAAYQCNDGAAYQCYYGAAWMLCLQQTNATMVQHTNTKCYYGAALVLVHEFLEVYPTLAAPSSMDMWESWPQACMRPSCWLRKDRPCVFACVCGLCVCVCVCLCSSYHNARQQHFKPRSFVCLWL